MADWHDAAGFLPQTLISGLLGRIHSLPRQMRVGDSAYQRGGALGVRKTRAEYRDLSLTRMASRVAGRSKDPNLRPRIQTTSRDLAFVVGLWKAGREVLSLGLLEPGTSLVNTKRVSQKKAIHPQPPPKKKTHKSLRTPGEKKERCNHSSEPTLAGIGPLTLSVRLSFGRLCPTCKPLWGLQSLNTACPKSWPSSDPLRKA